MDIVERLRDIAKRRSSRHADRVEWQAAAEIARLREELEARDGQIAAWLRDEEKKTPTKSGKFWLKHARIAIASGSYRKDEA